jgi:predicted RNA-binding protein with PIN domain
MLYIVDGNNLMGRSRTRFKLLEMLAGFAAVRRARVQVVFDGAPEDRYPEGSAYHGVKIAYSYKGSDADSRIKDMLESSRNPRELTIVTSDRSLIGLARACGAKQVSAADFLNRLDEIAKNREQPAEKPTADGDLKEWLRYFGEES